MENVFLKHFLNFKTMVLYKIDKNKFVNTEHRYISPALPQDGTVYFGKALRLFPTLTWFHVWSVEKWILFSWFLWNCFYACATYLLFWNDLLVPWTYLTITPAGHLLGIGVNIFIFIVAVIPPAFKLALDFIRYLSITFDS